MKGLSICIPIYNFNCIDSIKTLCKQLYGLHLNAEVLAIDDASNIILNELSNYKNQFYSYEKLRNNIGRSKIRNLLVKKAKFNYILFLDGDSGITKNFIKNYILSIENSPNTVICGGTIYQETFSKSNSLRYNYGKKIEETSALVRRKKPYHCLTTNNFIAPKTIMEKIPFNEELTKYGHEDTFFGYELEKNNVAIIHLDM